jgi:hypothetical protein
MPDTIINSDASILPASTFDLAEQLWQLSRAAHAEFNATAAATEITDPMWEGPVFGSLGEAVRASELALIEHETTTLLGLLRKLELLADLEGHENCDPEDASSERSVKLVAGVIRDLRLTLGMPEPTTTYPRS